LTISYKPPSTKLLDISSGKRTPPDMQVGGNSGSIPKDLQIAIHRLAESNARINNDKPPTNTASAFNY
jgi:hypothetical protein